MFSSFKTHIVLELFEQDAFACLMMSWIIYISLYIYMLCITSYMHDNWTMTNYLGSHLTI